MDKIIQMILAVTYQGESVIVQAPKEDLERFDSAHCEESNFQNCPKKPGVYACNVIYIPDDEEPIYKIVNSKEISIESYNVSRQVEPL